MLLRLGRPAPKPPAARARGPTSSRMATPAAAPTAATTATVSLVSFDVDGTLIRGKAGDRKANALHKQAFSAAFAKCFDLDTHIDVCRHDGGTDPLILIKVLVEHHGLPPEEVNAKLPEMQRAMLDHYFSAAAAAEEASSGGGGGEGGQGKGEGAAAAGGAAAGAAATRAAAAGASSAVARPGDGLELLPGAKETLEALAALGPSVAASCLVTGNLEPIGWSKMRALGIEGLFTGPPRFGGFGSDHCTFDTREMWRDRAEFVRVARRRADAALAASGLAVARHWHVGDTPADVRAALHAGAGSIGVATGAFSAEELRRAADEALAELAGKGEVSAAAGAAEQPLPPVVVLEHGLRDVDAVLAAMGLPVPSPSAPSR